MGLESGIFPTHPATANADPAAHPDAIAPPYADASADTTSDSSTDACSYPSTDAATNSSTDARTDTGPDRPSGSEGTAHQCSHVTTRRRCPDPRHGARGRAAGGRLS